MQEIIRGIVESIRYSGLDTGLPDTQQPGFRIRKENFFDIRPGECRKPVVFIDGGSAELIRSPSISLLFNRVYSTVYVGDKRIRNHLSEFYTLVTAGPGGEAYSAATYPVRNHTSTSVCFSSFDKGLMQANRRVPPSVAGDAVRRLAELGAALVQEDAIVIIDGSLEQVFSQEEPLLARLYSSKNIVCGLSKTTSMITANGQSLAALLSSLAQKPMWYYFAKQHDGYSMSYAKLNARSE